MDAMLVSPRTNLRKVPDSQVDESRLRGPTAEADARTREEHLPRVQGRGPLNIDRSQDCSAAPQQG